MEFFHYLKTLEKQKLAKNHHFRPLSESTRIHEFIVFDWHSFCLLREREQYTKKWEKYRKKWEKYKWKKEKLENIQKKIIKMHFFGCQTQATATASKRNSLITCDKAKRSKSVSQLNSPFLFIQCKWCCLSYLLVASVHECIDGISVLYIFIEDGRGREGYGNSKNSQINLNYVHFRHKKPTEIVFMSGRDCALPLCLCCN